MHWKTYSRGQPFPTQMCHVGTVPRAAAGLGRGSWQRSKWKVVSQWKLLNRKRGREPETHIHTRIV